MFCKALLWSLRCCLKGTTLGVLGLKGPANKKTGDDITDVFATNEESPIFFNLPVVFYLQAPILSLERGEGVF